MMMEQFRHFSHPHGLRIYQVQAEDDEVHCSGCESVCLGSVYGCWDCKFFLHKNCADARRSLHHPSHPSHHLTLLPSSTYPDASFLCNACGGTGNAFCFCCANCEVDLHVSCALLPQEIELKPHRHMLSLVFSQSEGSFSPPRVCKVCRRAVDSKYWSYSCSSCDFHVHTYCATPKLQAGEHHPKGEADYTGMPFGATRNEYGHFGAGNMPPFTKEEAGYAGVSHGGYGFGKFSRPGNEYAADYSNTSGAPVKPVVMEDPALKAQAELHELQMQLQIANEMAKMMASFNLSSLV